MADLLVSHLPVEVLRSSDAALEVAQVPVEVLHSSEAALEVAQLPVEVLRGPAPYADITTAAPSVSAAGTVAIVGLIAVTTAAPTVAGSADVVIVGTGAVTTAAPTVSAAFTIAEVTTPAPTVAADGLVSVGGSGGGTTPPPGGGGYGIVPVWIDPTTLVLRRQRRAQFILGEGKQLAHTRFELRLEAGMGLTDGQGDDPQLMLRFSDDGGHTWSCDHWTAAGRQGEYRRRALWRRLGQSRRRLYEVTLSDPVKIAWVGAWVDVHGGVS